MFITNVKFSNAHLQQRFFAIGGVDMSSAKTRDRVVYTPYSNDTLAYTRAVISYVCNQLQIESVCRDNTQLSATDNAVQLLRVLANEVNTVLDNSPTDLSAKDALKMMIEQRAIVLPSVYSIMIASFMPTYTFETYVDEEDADYDFAERKQRFLRLVTREIEALQALCENTNTDNLVCADIQRLIDSAGVTKRLWYRIALFNAGILEGLRDAAMSSETE